MPSSPRRRRRSLLWLAGLGLALAAGRARAAYTWKPVAIHGGGFVPGLAYSPVQSGLLYARTDVGGFYRWDNAASTWIPLTDMFTGSQANVAGGESIAPDPVDPNVVYAAGGLSGNGSMLRSADQGNTWTVYPTTITMGGNNDGRQAGERLAVDPHLTSKLYFGSRSQGLWVSTDSAATWTQVASFPVLGDAGYGLAWVIFGAAGSAGTASATVYVGVVAMASGNCNVYRSSNAGATWSLIPGGPSNMVTTHASLGSDGRLWMVYDSGGYGPGAITNGQVWQLNTATLAWTNVTPPGGPPSGSGGYGGVSVDAQNPQHAVAISLDWWSGNDKAFATANGGATWTTIASSSTGWNSPPFANYANDGALWTRGCGSADTGTMGWTCSIKIDPFNSNNAVYGTGGGVWSSSSIQAASQPTGVTWGFSDAGIEETVPLFMEPADLGNILFSCLGDVGGMRHTNLDQSPASGAYCGPSFTNTNMLDQAESNPNLVVRVGNSGTVTSDVAYSTDNGQTWTAWGSAPAGYSTANQMSSVAVAADGSRIVVSPFSGYGSPAYASSPGGAWTACTGLPSGAWVAADRSTASTFYATSPSQWVYGGTVTVYRSSDGGATFAAVNTIPVNWGDANGSGQFVAPRPVFGMPGEFWVSTYGNLYRFTNGGATVANISNVFEPLGGVGFGKAAPGQSHPAVYVSGIVGGVRGLFRCDDGTGAAWVRINDDLHQYGNPNWMEGDESIYGRVYIAAGGRGMLYGDMGLTPTATVTATPTPSVTPSRTATPSPTPTSTATRTVTAAATPSPSPSATGSVTPTATPTASPASSASASPSASPSASLTPSLTGTRTPSPAGSPTTSPTLTPSALPTLSLTPTPTASASGTPAATVSASPSPSGTAALTPTSTATMAPTSTQTPMVTATPSASATAMSTSSPSATPPASPSATLTVGSSATLTPAATPTGTPTPSLTASPAATFSPTATDSSTATSSSTATATVTPTTSPTTTVLPLVLDPISPGTISAGTPVPVTLTGSFGGVSNWVLVNGVALTPTTLSQTTLWLLLPAQNPMTLSLQVLGGGRQSNLETLQVKAPPTPSPTLAAGSGPLVISGCSGLPDPNPQVLAVQLTGPADRLDLAVYTEAEVLALGWRASGLEAGWNSVALPPAFSGLPNGVYYVRLVAYRGRQASVARLIKVMVLH